MNLYAFVENNGICAVDILGLSMHPVATQVEIITLFEQGLTAAQIADLLCGAVTLAGVEEAIRKHKENLANESRKQGKGERGKARTNPNPDKEKSRDHQTGKKLPPKVPEPPRPPEVPTIPRGKSK